MRVISFNCNGIRSAAEKGFFSWARRQQADVICLQEVRAEPDQIPPPARAPRGYQTYFFPAIKKGYSGVAVYTKNTPERVVTRLGWETFDDEGRWLQLDFGALSVVSLYLPSGSAGPERQARKFVFMEQLLAHLTALASDGREYIIVGDWNIAHQKIDLENWRGNQKNSGFLPEERAWLDTVFGLGWVDVFRKLNPEPREYTWWSNRGQARANNVGWRIDYQIATPKIAATASATSIYRKKFFSDHAPLTVDYVWP